MVANTIGVPLKYVITVCYGIVHNYGIAIIAFTLVTKVILFPVSVWTHTNSLKMVSMMPELNKLKVSYYGDKETIGEKTQELYKKKHYNPFLPALPMVIQLVLLTGVIGAVRGLLRDTGSILTKIPYESGGVALFMPVAAGGAALLLGWAQNHINPLQREQSRGEQIMTNSISVGISLILGMFVPVGVGLYWASSNLFSILNQVILNLVIPAARRVDYDALAESRAQLERIENLSPKASKEEKRREKEDFRRFFSVVNKHLVFYSEKSGFYKYFRGMIEYLLEHSNVIIHYVTSDPNDQIFALAGGADKAKGKNNYKGLNRIRPYYIGQKRLITLMMKMDADVVVMTTPDLDNYYLKRSYVRKDVEYIYTDHGISSTTMVVRKGAYDHFDTIFCKGQFQMDEIRETEMMYHLPQKKLIPVGFGMLDDLIAQYSLQKSKNDGTEKILIAPSWQKDNILDSCIDAMVPSLLAKGYFVTIRPHPEYIKRFPKRMHDLLEKYGNMQNLEIEADFSSNTTIFMSDLVVTDWSSIAYEFSLCTLRPTLFVDTPMKVLNSEYEKYSTEPIDISWRNEIGKSLSPQDAGRAGEFAEMLLADGAKWRERIDKVLHENIFNIGTSAAAAGQYILSAIKKKQSKMEGL